MGLFGRKRSEEQMQQVRNQIRELSRRVDTTDKKQTELTTEVRRASSTTEQMTELEHQINDLQRRLGATPTHPEPTTSADAGSSNDGNPTTDADRAVDDDDTPLGLPRPSQQFSIADQAVIDELRLRLDRIEREISAVDNRVSAIGNELAQQITEISGDIERLDGAAPTATGDVADDTLSALRTGQERLANEQARYQIAFRQDLAQLAERIKRA